MPWFNWINLDEYRILSKSTSLEPGPLECSNEHGQSPCAVELLRRSASFALEHKLAKVMGDRTAMV